MRPFISHLLLGIIRKGRSWEAVKRRRIIQKAMKKENKKRKLKNQKKAEEEALNRTKFEAVHFKRKYEALKKASCLYSNSTTVPSLKHGGTMTSKLCSNHQLFLTSKLPGCNMLSASVMQFPDQEIILGEGVFGKVTKAVFKTLNIPVAVKSGKGGYFSAISEAKVLQCLAGHQGFPYSFGVYNNMLVMECLASEKGGIYHVNTLSYHLNTFCKRSGSDFESNPKLFKHILSEKEWLKICYLITDAVRYMHSKFILHNDIKGDNIILSVSSSESHYVPKLCDFGKATHKLQPRTYNLTEKEIAKYNSKHRHLAYELRNVKGSRQSPMTDLYSLGYTFKSVAYFQHIASLKLIAHKMKDHDPTNRPSLNVVLCDIKKLIQ